MNSDSWAFLRKRNADPDEHDDPWDSRSDPWLANVYQFLFIRRQDRA